MRNLPLGAFIEEFLLKQNLPGFNLKFDPVNDRKGNRRAKRINAAIDACDLNSINFLSDKKTIDDLFEAFQKFVPESRDWMAYPRAYKPSLLDDQGDTLSPTETLGDVRKKPYQRAARHVEEVSKMLTRCLDFAENGLEPVDARDLVERLVAQRYSKLRKR